MPRPISIPKLTRHKASGKAVVRLNGRDHYVGIFGTAEAETAYNRLIGEWLVQDPAVHSRRRMQTWSVLRRADQSTRCCWRSGLMLDSTTARRTAS